MNKQDLIKAAFALDNTNQSAPQGPPAGRPRQRPAGSPASLLKQAGVGTWIRGLWRSTSDDAAEAAGKGLAKGMRGSLDDAAEAAAKSLPEAGGQVMSRASRQAADPAAEAARRRALNLHGAGQGPPPLKGAQPKPRPPKPQPKVTPQPKPTPKPTGASQAADAAADVAPAVAKEPGIVRKTVGTLGTGLGYGAGGAAGYNMVHGRAPWDMGLPPDPVEGHQIGWGEGQYPPDLFTLTQLQQKGYDISQLLGPNVKPLEGELGAYQIENTPRLNQMRYDLLTALAPYQMRRPDFAKDYGAYVQGELDPSDDALIAYDEYEKRMMPLLVNARAKLQGEPPKPTELWQNDRWALEQFMGDQYDPLVQAMEGRGAPQNQAAFAAAIKKAQQRYQMLKQMEMAHYFR